VTLLAVALIFLLGGFTALKPWGYRDRNYLSKPKPKFATTTKLNIQLHELQQTKLTPKPNKLIFVRLKK